MKIIFKYPQKELLYLSDAVGHETSIIEILNESLKNLDDDRLVTFLEEEITKHESIKEGLKELMEDKCE